MSSIHQNQRLKNTLLVVGVATLAGLVFTSQSYVISISLHRKFNWGEEALKTMSAWYLWAALLPFILFLARKFPFDRGIRMKSLPVHLAAAALIGPLHTSAHFLIYTWLPYPERLWSEIEQDFIANFTTMSIWRFTLYFAFLALCIAIDYNRKARDLEIQSTLIENRILRSEMESLTIQIDPQFLFGSLNKLSDLMHADLDGADFMVARLGDYLRMTLENSSQSEITLREEIEFLECYVEIESLKLRSHIPLEIKVEDNTLDHKVPNLILQAPVEDAIRRRSVDSSQTPIKIFITRNGGMLQLNVLDSTINSDGAPNPRLDALFSRLETIYGSSVQLQSYSDRKGFNVSITMPVNLEKLKKDQTTPLENPEQAGGLNVDDPDYSPNTKKRWITSFIIWSFVSTYFAIYSIAANLSSGREIDWSTILTNFIGWYAWAILTPFIVKFSARHPFQKGHILKSAAMHALMLSAALTIATTFLIFLRWLDGPRDQSFYEAFPALFAAAPFSIDTVCYCAIIAVETAFRNYRRLQFGKRRSARLGAQLARARLQTLKMQLHPHFLFNALNSISELMQEDPKAAEEMIKQLQKFLQLTVNSSDTQEIPFKEELEFLDCYLAIERVRFHDRLKITMKIEPESLTVSVPNLMLQPIVENAIKHGIAPRTTPGEIDISASTINGVLKIVVRDNGPGLTASQRKVIQNTSGLGLSNTRERLRQMYGKEHRFELKNAPEGGLIVTLEIPSDTPISGTQNRKVS